jgi:hypothetical protein
MTNQRADGGFDENHVMVTLSLPVVVLLAHPLAAAPSQDRIAWLSADLAPGHTRSGIRGQSSMRAVHSY